MLFIQNDFQGKQTLNRFIRHRLAGILVFMQIDGLPGGFLGNVDFQDKHNRCTHMHLSGEGLIKNIDILGNLLVRSHDTECTLSLETKMNY